MSAVACWHVLAELVAQKLRIEVCCELPQSCGVQQLSVWLEPTVASDELRGLDVCGSFGSLLGVDLLGCRDRPLLV